MFLKMVCGEAFRWMVRQKQGIVRRGVPLQGRTGNRYIVIDTYYINTPGTSFPKRFVGRPPRPQ